LKSKGITLPGEELSQYLKVDVLEIPRRSQVLARSCPRDKLRLVTLLMEIGEVVAITEDRSNDSPAPRKANVSLSMEICGTELAKLVADIVILDDNFQSIVSALKWCRCVDDEIQAFIQF
jgi:Ca2+-transporting ATPase